jgi:hypothetical protein
VCLARPPLQPSRGPAPRSCCPCQSCLWWDMLCGCLPAAVEHGVDAMRNGQHRAVCELAADGFLDQLVCRCWRVRTRSHATESTPSQHHMPVSTSTAAVAWRVVHTRHTRHTRHSHGAESGIETRDSSAKPHQARECWIGGAAPLPDTQATCNAWPQPSWSPPSTIPCDRAVCPPVAGLPRGSRPLPTSPCQPRPATAIHCVHCCCLLGWMARLSPRPC